MKVRGFMIVRDSIQQQFKQAFPEERIHAVRALVDLAYESADALYQYQPNEGMYNLLRETKVGKGIWADVLRAGIACAAKMFCKKGILPYVFETPMNCARNCHHVKLCDGDVQLYFARTQYQKDIPRKALYRASDIFQQNLFDKTFEIGKISTFAATYGDGGDHVFRYGCIGVPGEKAWIYSEPLKTGAYQYPTKQEKTEILVQLNEEFRKGLRRDEKNNGGVE